MVLSMSQSHTNNLVHLGMLVPDWQVRVLLNLTICWDSDTRLFLGLCEGGSKECPELKSWRPEENGPTIWRSQLGNRTTENVGHNQGLQCSISEHNPCSPWILFRYEVASVSRYMTICSMTGFHTFTFLSVHSK